MAQETAAKPDRRGRDWQQIGLAFLAGFTVFSFMSAFVIVHQPAIGATINALPLFVVTFVIGVIALPLLRWGTSSGYGLAILAALAGLASLALVGSGTIGSMKPGTPPIAPPVYAVIAIVVLVSAYNARSG